jgi:hyperosmotically inducible periplasmic protein
LRIEQEDESMHWLRGGQRWMGALLIIGLLVGCAATAEKRSTGEVIDDATITTKVKANLLADPMVSSFAISVETSRGVVSLTGIVNSAGERAQAIQVTQETGGVRRVDARNLFIKQ